VQKVNFVILQKEERVDIKNIEVGSNSSVESDISESEDEEDIPDDEGMDELLAEMKPMGADSDDEREINDAMAAMEEDLDEDEREEIGDDEDEDGEDQEKPTGDSKKSKSGAAETQDGRLEQEKRTVCVTNVAVTTKKKKLMSLFKKYGPVESIRFRNVSFSKGGKSVSHATGAFIFLIHIYRFIS
jgi:RNA recognition motif-containing protein